MAVQILVGDCRETLAGLEAGRFHTCVTSPPYWGLRDYGTEPLEWPAIAYAPLAGLPPCVEIPAMRCSLGLEPTLEAFIGHMLLVFREVKRVLRDDGTCWVNMGDCYATGAGKVNTAPGGGTQGERWKGIRGDDKLPNMGPVTQPNRMPQPGLKPKDLAGQPWRLSFALQADGWWLRSDVIWNKRNPMPESTKDRPTKSHEYVFLLAKSESYYYDGDAIKEPASEDTHARYARGRSSEHKHAQEVLVPGNKPQTIAQSFSHMRKLAPAGSGTKNNDSFDAAMAVMPEHRNKRSVWTLPTEGYKEAHFATFPTKLIEPCILAGCPEGGEVLDCFGGSGTTGLVADRLGRNAVLCELNPSYAAMADKRLAGDVGHVARQIGMQLEDAQ